MEPGLSAMDYRVEAMSRVFDHERTESSGSLSSWSSLTTCEDPIAMLVRLQKLFGPEVRILKDDREFVRSGSMEKLCKKGPRLYYFHLFTDCLIYSTKKKHRLKLHGMIPLRCLRTSVATRIKFAFLPGLDSEWEAHSFTIESPQKSFLVKANSPTEKVAWVRTVSELQDLHCTVIDHTSLASILVPERLAKVCTICQTKFSLRVKKHHCKMCGNIVCGKCSPAKDMIPSFGNIQVRICKLCVTINERLRNRAGRTESFGFVAHDDEWDLDSDASDVESELMKVPVSDLGISSASKFYLPKQKRTKKKRRARTISKEEDPMESKVVSGVVSGVVSEVVSGVFVPEEESLKPSKLDLLQQKLNAAQNPMAANKALKGGLLAQALSDPTALPHAFANPVPPAGAYGAEKPSTAMGKLMERRAKTDQAQYITSDS